MAQTFNVTPPAPTTVTEAGWPSGALIKNTGAATLYACDMPGVQENGFPIDPNGTLSWDAGRPLYLSAGAPTSAVVDENSGSMASSPQDIANALIGTGNLPGLIAQQISLMGVPPIDVPAPLGFGMTSGAVVGKTVSLAAGTDVSRYNSVQFYFQITNPKPSASCADVNALSISMGGLIGDANNVFCPSTQLRIEGHSSCVISGVVPVTGSVLQAEIDTAANGYTFTGQLVGSFKNAEPSFTVSNWQWAGVSLQSASGYVADVMQSSRFTDALLTIPANGGSGQVTASLYPSYCSGPLTYSQQISSGTIASNTFDMYLTSSSALGLLAGGYSASGNAISTFPAINVGGRQPIIHVNNRNNNNVTCRFSLGGSYS